MSYELRPYAEYRESGLSWLGEIPAHWTVTRVKRLLREVDDRSETGEETLLSLRQERGLVPHNDVSDKVIEPVHLVGYKRVRSDEVVLNRMQASNGMFAKATAPGLVSPDYAVFQPISENDTDYLVLLFKSPTMRAKFRAESKGLGTGTAGFLRLYSERFTPVAIALPPPQEQRQIVAFVRVMDRKFASIIRAKRRLIDLLNEQKQAIIHRAVTRGLDPDVRLKPSGVGWIGEVPEHWEISRVKREFECLDNQRVPLSSSERGTMTSRKFDYYGASGVIDKVDNYLFDDSLLLLAEDGANLVLRNLPLAIVACGKFWVNNHAHVLKPIRGNLEFLANLMETIDYRPWITGAAQPKLTGERLLSIVVPVPPAEEQDLIMEWVNAVTRSLRIAIGRAQREISLIREYRTRLIADVVSGKVDVRGLAADLPDSAADEMQTFEEADDLGEDEEIDESVDAGEDDFAAD